MASEAVDDWLKLAQNKLKNEKKLNKGSSEIENPSTSD
jgi:hypothetical protein